mgnify:CR=1 FL=1
MKEDFLLSSSLAKELYVAADRLPVIDLADDLKYAEMCELWQQSDHYKHCALRIAGVDEVGVLLNNNLTSGRS